ncbi:bifunctional NAD(P)/FAD-dependent oxidoreductase/class I SAM-dependent methyltransferase [Nonomuraea zeae]|uniref:NAD(P)/FAD-dependent oxidoreductase n=1 Tax=Nonomuraea zeae TaxID=1642303 RepID=A0A5S4GDT1_9ACTN|nr:bifunctional NAD(P)/FAD-dependent oxidoreductase/class I SAM-dependent methyltransferase [Nonomuraea zeae]TMR24230.1 NAD(P)/FAD-dependent oxidoreductase [Nonomuraea zeae]
MDARYDVVVIGGGAAGLSGALALGRARRKVLVIDAGQPRNAPAQGVHVYLARESVPPLELLAAGRHEVEGYGGEIVTGSVATAERLDGGGFRLVLDDGAAVEAARLLVATGSIDEWPQVPGLAELWGQDVLHCPYCHGWEVRDQPIGILATGPMAVHQALLWRQWSADLTLFLNTWTGLEEEQREQLAARGIAVVAEPVTGLAVTEGRLSGVELAGGRSVPCRALAVATRGVARTSGLAGLGLETAEQEALGHSIGVRVTVDAMGATSVPGVWAAGNVTNLTEQVMGSAAAGVRAGAAINADLIAEETRAAVAAHRAGASGDETAGHHAPGQAADLDYGAEYWDGRYAERPQLWSGQPNEILAREAAGLTPGRALDLGSGEGGDAIWLAGLGWRVTAADISGVALDRAATLAKAAEVQDRIDWQRHDLGVSFPEGEFELVSACYLHSLGDMPRDRILRAAAAAVVPGGVLLVVGHAGWPAGAEVPHPGVHFPTPQEVLDALELPEGEWEVLRAEEFERTYVDPDGREGTRPDNVLKLRRRG